MNSSKNINILRKLKGDSVWHRNYYDHIVRNEKELFQIRHYIRNNPRNWKKDCHKLSYL